MIPGSMIMSLAVNPVLMRSALFTLLALATVTHSVQQDAGRSADREERNESRGGLQ